MVSLRHLFRARNFSTCGMSEEEMQERGIPYEVGIARFRETSTRAHIMGLEHGMLKMLFSIENPPRSGCADRGRRGHRTDPYRASRAEPERYSGLLCAEHVQLSDHIGRGL